MDLGACGGVDHASDRGPVRAHQRYFHPVLFTSWYRERFQVVFPVRYLGVDQWRSLLEDIYLSMSRYGYNNGVPRYRNTYSSQALRKDAGSGGSQQK